MRTDLIADMPRDERPRERLLMHGAAPLSNAELLALLIGTGIRGKSAVQLARELLRDGVRQLGRRDVAELARVSGVGTAKATRIAAAFELSRRTTGEDGDEEGVKYSPETFGRQLIATHQFRQEHVGLALLDAHDIILKQKTVFIGTLNSALVSTREIVLYPLLNNATGVVLYHNHPSGNPTPSAYDSNFTQKVREALDLMDIELIDHVIVGSTKYYSMKERGGRI
jgi:DNA repair protein RadC